MDSLITFLITLITCAIIWAIIYSLRSKTWEYRKNLSNLYVAGKIRQIATKDSIDLDKEVKSFRKFDKLLYMNQLAFDNALEEEMKEKIVNDFEEAEKKSKK